ncbi:MAG: hypothetical protein OXI77_00215 [Chloroflexota bacterium]|nr:hypothetical protein [Chloroflexota bacterium]MDE2911122.1 hypothetical protein [Chloroflexota bacterium]
MSCAVEVGACSNINLSDMRLILGEHGAKFIELISYMAQKRNLALYIAGGFARDLLLNRGTLDLDFVLEGDAIGFARLLSKSFGGAVDIHKPFGTAKWILDTCVADSLSLAVGELPASIDFVMARSESYARPAALPAVAPADIESDLRRRDFSVNALAIQISPQIEPWPLVDFCDGIDDLKRGKIRALHDQSFVDDPTRILRALRYADRLGFELEADSSEWIEMALPYLARTTGQRLRNEIGLVLHETKAGETMLRLQELGALVNIHPAFRISSQLPELLTRCQKLSPPWSTAVGDMQTLSWIALMAGISSVEAQSLCERLALTNKLTQAITASARLREQICLLDDPDIRPSRVALLLDEFPDIALQANWLLAEEKPAAQALIAAYASDWRWRRPTITGDDLTAKGLAPGPLFRQILNRLRFAWIDCEICSAEDEAALLQRILEAED